MKKIFVFFIIISIMLSITININYATDEVEPESGNNESNNEEIINNNNDDNTTSNPENENNNENNEENNNYNENNSDNNNDNTITDNNEDSNNESNNNNSNDNNINTNKDNNTKPVSANTVTQVSNSNKTDNNSKSDNTYLKSLELDVQGLSPEFKKSNTEYYLVVDLAVENINVEAKPEDKNATVSINGNTNLDEGKNTIKISVTAEDGSVRNYFIYVTRTDDAEGTNANLKSLTISGKSLYPKFKPNIYSYSLSIDKKITELDISLETENENATYEIIGNENLEEGDNLIKIVVTAKDGETKKEYKINAFISAKTVNIKQENKLGAVILLIILGIGILVTTILIKKK